MVNQMKRLILIFSLLIILYILVVIILWKLQYLSDDNFAALFLSTTAIVGIAKVSLAYLSRNPDKPD